ncbi:hypothetical protein C8R44DRAFT_732889 [Mycena epipterygia]|nr:hypothetical protein C8R44DRAFT_732889 [Mycena epipterygia]
MLRHRRSLAALPSFASASASSATESINDPEEEEEEDDGSPLPLGLTRASMRTTPKPKLASSASSVNGNGKPVKDGGLIRRVSSLFRSSSSSKNTGCPNNSLINVSGKDK